MYIAIDFGSTNTRIASSRNLESFYKVTRFQTDKNLLSQRNLISEAIKEVADGEEVRFIGIGIHGLVDTVNYRFLKLPNYEILDGKPFSDLLGHEFSDTLVFIENDAAMAGLAESEKGAGINHKVVAYLTISTGIGGVRIVDNKLERGCTFEPGHQIIVKDGKHNEFSKLRGDFEVYSSGGFFESNFGVKPVDCVDEEIWKNFSQYLGVGVHNVINLWSPDVIVLGGGIGYNKFENYYQHLHDYLKSIEFVPVPEIKKAELGDDAGLYGALTLIRRSKYLVN